MGDENNISMGGSLTCSITPGQNTAALFSSVKE